MRCGPSTPDRVFIFGMGYTSQALAHVLQQQGWDVAGTCRSEEKRAALEARGFRAHLFNYGKQRLREEAIQELRESSHVVSSIPPEGDSDPVLDSYRGELPQWMGYLSSTSVYGDWQGEWVDEATEPRPVEKRAVARWEAEKQWMELARGTGACVRVFRMGGVYGPGRSALHTVRSRDHSATQRLREQKRFTSRVHVDDVCQVIVKAMTSERSPGARVYNVVDDDPSPRAEAMAHARQLLNVEDDDLSSDNELSAESESFTLNGQVSKKRVSEKRVSNRRLKAELQVELLHPSFRSGLEAVASASDLSFD